MKILSALLKGITSKHVGNFYCFYCFYFFTSENDLCKYNLGEKYERVPFILYIDVECLVENISTCRNDPNNSLTIKINEHTPSGYSLLTFCSFDNTKNRLSHYRDQDCMKMLCKELQEHTKRVIYCEKKRNDIFNR